MALPTRFLNIPSSDGAGLRNLTTSCMNLFAECLRIEGLSSEQTAWFEDCQARLRWWSFGLHVQSSGKSSLDHRLSHRQDVRDAISGLLKALSSTLNTCLVEARSLGRPDDDDAHVQSDPSSSSGSGLPESSLSDASDDNGADTSAPSQGVSTHHAYFIEMTMRRLMRFSILIRKSGDKFRHKRADDDLKKIQVHAPDTYAEFQTHLETLILVGPYEHALLARLRSETARHHIPQSVNIVIQAWLRSRLGQVQKRLAQANIIRRHRIMCSRKGGGLATQPQPSLPQPAPTPTMRRSSAQPRGDAPGSQAQRTDVAPSIPVVRVLDEGSAVQTATAIGSDLNMSMVRSVKASSAVTKLTRTGQYQDYPKPWVLEKSPLCPYCGIMLDPEYTRNQAKWQ